MAVQRFLNRLPYNTEPGGDTLRSFRQVVRRGTAHCLEAALFAACVAGAARLSAAADGAGVGRRARPRHLRLSPSRPLGRRWRGRAIRACTGESRCSVRRARSPRAISIRTSTTPAASPATRSSHLRVMGSYDWRFSRRNVWAVERMLLDVPAPQDQAVAQARATGAGEVPRVSGEAQKEAAVLPRPREVDGDSEALLECATPRSSGRPKRVRSIAA